MCYFFSTKKTYLGTHNTEATINKQLNDKGRRAMPVHQRCFIMIRVRTKPSERVAAALENPPVLRIINHGVADDEEANCWSLL